MYAIRADWEELGQLVSELVLELVTACLRADWVERGQLVWERSSPPRPLLARAPHNSWKSSCIDTFGNSLFSLGPALTWMSVKLKGVAQGTSLVTYIWGLPYMKLIILLRCKCVLSQHLSHLELEGQLKMLKLVPKVSPSSRVLGRCLNNVSGRNRAVWKKMDSRQRSETERYLQCHQGMKRCPLSEGVWSCWLLPG